VGNTLKALALNGTGRHLAASTLVWALAVGIVYFLSAWLGVALSATPSGVAVFWPASGVAAGILMAFGRRARPALVMGVVAGTVAAHLLSDGSLSTAAFKAFCNAGEALLVVWLLERWFGPTFACSDLGWALSFFAAALLAAAASALAGAATMTLFHSAAPFSEVWRAWFLSHAIGITTTAPLVVGLARTWHELPSRRELIAGLGLVSLMALLGAHMLTHPTDSWLSFGPGYVELPLLLWLAARYPPTFAIIAAFVLSILIICATVFGIGRFGDANVPVIERVQGAQLTVTMITVLTLVLVALFAERNQRETALQLALDGAEAGAFSADLATGHLECDARAASIHGHQVPPTTIQEARRFIHRDDLEHIDTDLAKARTRGGSWNAEYRVTPPPGDPHCGETRWVAIDSSFVRDARGIPARLLGIIRDITDRKRAEQAMAERNAQLELASRVAGVGSFSVDFASGRVRLSPGCATLYGLPEGTIDMPRHDARAHVHPEELAWLEAVRNQAFLEQKHELVAQFRIVRPDDGEIRWVEVRSLIAYGKDGRPLHMIGVCFDVSERKQAEDHKSSLVSELDHRVKNTLACVGVIVEQTRTASITLDGFAEVLRGRIRSLANAHALLSCNRWHGVQLGEIVRTELTRCMRDGNTLIEGPAVEVSADSVQPIAMVLHELATNAAKYGALSSGGGQVRVRWDLQSSGSSRDGLIVQWRETGGPPVVTPSPPGYGMSVIRDLIPYELGGVVDFVFAADGVDCRLQIPSKWVSLRGTTSRRDASNEVSERLRSPS
jgi:PAS domain S-box-containing protein